MSRRVSVRQTNAKTVCEFQAIRLTKTLSYWSSGGEKTLKSEDGKAGFILVFGNGEAFSPENQKLGEIFQSKYDGNVDGFRLYAGGVGVIGNAINKKIADDLKLAEGISIPLTFVLLAFVFGALAASAMPLIVGVAAILGAFFILFLISLVTDVSVYALNLTTGMGLGLGIDYMPFAGQSSNTSLSNSGLSPSTLGAT